MPLNFKFADTTPRELFEYEQDGKMYWHPRGECLVFFTMLLQHKLTGEMTDETLIEIARRIALIELFHNDPHYWEGDVGYRIGIPDIIAYWGLTTNVSHLNKRDWDAYYKRCFIERPDKHFINRLRSTERIPWTTNSRA